MNRNFERQYKSVRWTRLSKAIRREEPLCRLCKRQGIFKAAEEVDHVVPVAAGLTDEGFYDRRNLQPLCKSCHFGKTAQENKERNRSERVPEHMQEDMKRWDELVDEREK